MIFDFLFPIIGWLIFFGILYFIYNSFFYKSSDIKVEEIQGQAVFTLISSFFWIVVYMCLSSIWSISYTLIDLKYPDVIGAPNDYGSAGLSLSGAVYDAMAFPLATLVVSAVTAVILALWIIQKQKSNPALRPEKLYKFIRFITFLGGAILAFSGFVYVVYSWLYGSLPMVVVLKGLVAFIIVGAVALYFYLVADDKRNENESIIGRVFAVFLLLAMMITLFVSFKVVGTPAEARKYRLDTMKISDLKQIKYAIDNRDGNTSDRTDKFSELTDEYVVGNIKRNQKAGNGFTLSSDGVDYKLCASFVSDMPAYINQGYDMDESWNYKVGNSCFTFKHKENYNENAKVMSPGNVPNINLDQGAAY